MNLNAFSIILFILCAIFILGGPFYLFTYARCKVGVQARLHRIIRGRRGDTLAFKYIYNNQEYEGVYTAPYLFVRRGYTFSLNVGEEYIIYIDPKRHALVNLHKGVNFKDVAFSIFMSCFGALALFAFKDQIFF